MMLKKYTFSLITFFLLTPNTSYGYQTALEFYEQYTQTPYTGKIYFNGQLSESIRFKKMVLFIEQRIGKDNTAKRLKASKSILHKLSKEKFMAYFRVYRPYIGDKGINLRLTKSFHGFHRKVTNLTTILLILSQYSTHSKIAATMLTDLVGFTESNPVNFQEIINIIQIKSDKSYFLTKGFLNINQLGPFLLANLQALAHTNSENLLNILNFLHYNYNESDPLMKGFFNRDQLISIMIENFRGFAMINLVELKKVIRILLIVPNKKNHSSPAYLTRGQIARAMERNFQGLTGINSKKLEDLITILQDLNFTHKEISHFLYLNAGTLAKLNIEDFKNIVSLLGRTLSSQEIKIVVTNNFYGLSIMTKKKGTFFFNGLQEIFEDLNHPLYRDFLINFHYSYVSQWPSIKSKINTIKKIKSPDTLNFIKEKLTSLFSFSGDLEKLLKSNDINYMSKMLEHPQGSDYQSCITKAHMFN